MTFRQILEVVWGRRWIVLALCSLVVASAIAWYVVVAEQQYESTATLRIGPAATSALDSGGSIAGADIDVDPESITSPDVLDLAAAELSLNPPSQLYGAISFQIVEGLRTNKAFITATTLDPTTSRNWANASAEAYVTYLADQVATALKSAREQRAGTVDRITTLQRQASETPDNAVVATNLASAISELGSINDQIRALEGVGAPVSLLTSAPEGSSTSTPLAIVIAIALFIGLALGVSVVLVHHQFDDRIRDEDTLEDVTELPLLATLQEDKSVRRGHASLPAAKTHRTTLTEGFRSLRTSIAVSIPSEKAVVVVTSSEPGEGKTFISANLAVTFARAGKSVILVGGDLRQPGLPAHLGQAADGAGLSNLLDRTSLPRQGDVAKLLKKTETDGLRVLPSGPEPLDPADLLASESLSSVIAMLRELADVVIVDSPPSIGLVDAALLGAHADGTVVVVSMRRAKTDRVLDTLKRLGSNHVSVLGVVANRSPTKLPSSYASYYLRADSTSETAPTASSASPAPKGASNGGTPTAPKSHKATKAQKPK